MIMEVKSSSYGDKAYQLMKSQVMQAARDKNCHEFVNRIDTFIVSQVVNLQQLCEIVKLEVST